MKKVFFAMMAAAMMISCGNTGAPRQTGDGLAQGADSLTGTFTAYDMEGYKLHVYNSNDVMGDASYIIEGKDSRISAFQGERQGVCRLHREAGQARGD